MPLLWNGTSSLVLAGLFEDPICGHLRRMRLDKCLAANYFPALPSAVDRDHVRLL